jgi:hypothetical protein
MTTTRQGEAKSVSDKCARKVWAYRRTSGRSSRAKRSCPEDSYISR